MCLAKWIACYNQYLLEIESEYKSDPRTNLKIVGLKKLYTMVFWITFFL